ncbi:hypothetical protein [Lentzea albidocapillata]|uniref:hypothetical protein n=1 Tax=Lentzea albidocapillata TaxID=40571 RepID=UPI003B846AF4
MCSGCDRSCRDRASRGVGVPEAAARRRRLPRDVPARFEGRPQPRRLWRSFVAGSLAWSMVLGGSRPHRWDYIGAAICVIGVAVYVPRG